MQNLKWGVGIGVQMGQKIEAKGTLGKKKKKSTHERQGAFTGGHEEDVWQTLLEGMGR